MNEQNQNDTQLSKQERRRLRNERKHERKSAEKSKIQRQKIIKRLIWLLIGVGIIVAVVFAASNKKILPPTSMQNHIEQSPKTHIVDKPMDNRIHKHMLEHADGTGPPGIIINYNCVDFDCEADLINKLTALVNEYPANVYLAPYPRMSAKLVLSALGRQEILNEFDEQKIQNFIGGRRNVETPADSPTDEISGFRIGENVIYVADQKPSTELTVNLVSLAKGGYVVIHEEVEGSPGEIIGNTLLLQPGDHNDVEVALQRASLEGESLIAMLHADNGDEVFAPQEDQPIKDDDGNIIFMVFSVSSIAEEPAAISL